MALKSSVHKVRLNVSNFNLNHYQDYSLTLAKHPSENDLRMMIRLLAFALNCHLDVVFTKGLSSDQEPDLWKINHDGSIEQWIELGLPDERRIRQACSKAHHVSFYTYHGQQAISWFDSIESKIQSFDHLSITRFITPEPQSLEAFADKGMDLSISIEDNDIWISNENDRILIEFKLAKPH